MVLESFDDFAEMIITMPAKAILDLLNLDCELLDQDLSRYRASFAADEYSLLCFRQFIRSLRSGGEIYPRECLPSEHLELYRHTVIRLIHVHELPRTAVETFDGAFVAVQPNGRSKITRAVEPGTK
jgi:hypothetical protein